MLIDKIGLQKYKFYRKLPRKIQNKIEQAFNYYERTKNNKGNTVNGHSYKWRETEFNRLLKVFYLKPNQ